LPALFDIPQQLHGRAISLADIAAHFAGRRPTLHQRSVPSVKPQIRNVILVQHDAKPPVRSARELDVWFHGSNFGRVVALTWSRVQVPHDVERNLDVIDGPTESGRHLLQMGAVLQFVPTLAHDHARNTV
jgi:hypothetical protein